MWVADLAARLGPCQCLWQVPSGEGDAGKEGSVGEETLQAEGGSWGTGMGAVCCQLSGGLGAGGALGGGLGPEEVSLHEAVGGKGASRGLGVVLSLC